MEEEVKGKRRSRGIEYDCGVYSGRKCIGSTLEVFEYSMSFFYVARNGSQVLG